MCSEPDCDKPSHARGLCQKHYMRAYREGLVENLTLYCHAKDCPTKIRSNSKTGLCLKHYRASRRKVPYVDWHERVMFPTKSWLPVEKSKTPVVHMETWLVREGGNTLVAACNSHRLLESRLTESPVPCRKCLKVLKDHGLIA